MSWAVVARKDFMDARRSRSLWFLTGLYVLLIAGMAYLFTLLPEMTQQPGMETTVVGLFVLLSGAVTLFVGITAVVIGHKAIAGETESGSGKLLLSFPHTRRDVVFGKLVGRSAILALSVLVGFAVALLVIIALFDEFSAVDYVQYTLLTLYYVLAYVSLVVGISATTKTTGRAAAFAVGVFFLLELLWDLVPLGANWLVTGEFTTILPDWANFLAVLTPSAAYGNAASWLSEGRGITFGSEVPFYLEGWFSLLILAVWIVVPITLGYLRYSRADL